MKGYSVCVCVGGGGGPARLYVSSPKLLSGSRLNFVPGIYTRPVGGLHLLRIFPTQPLLHKISIQTQSILSRRLTVQNNR
jgi:hypothetical protein